MQDVQREMGILSRSGFRKSLINTSLGNKSFLSSELILGSFERENILTQTILVFSLRSGTIKPFSTQKFSKESSVLLDDMFTGKVFIKLLSVVGLFLILILAFEIWKPDWTTCAKKN